MRQPLSAFALALTLAVSPAFAGIADSPLPVLISGQKTLHLYSVPGVLRVAGLGTFFACTSTATATIQVGVELFAGPGLVFNDAVATSLSVLPGQTVIFGTDAPFGFPVSSNLFGSANGSARILATSKNVVCTAWVAEIFTSPPAASWQLNILKKTKQSGD